MPDVENSRKSGEVPAKQLDNSQNVQKTAVLTVPAVFPAL